MGILNRLLLSTTFCFAIGVTSIERVEAQSLADAAVSTVGNPLSSVFGEKGELELKDSINYDDCFEYSEKAMIVFNWPECHDSMGDPWPVMRYTAEYTEPTVLVEVVYQPGGGALQTESSLGNIPGQGGLIGNFLGNGSGAGRSGTYAGNTNPNMPTSGRMPNVYFDAHVWGVGPLGFLEAVKGGDSPINMLKDPAGSALSTVTDALPVGLPSMSSPVPGVPGLPGGLGIGGDELIAMKSMICWLAEAEDYWLTDPISASRHLEFLALAPELYVRARLGDWGATWFNHAGSSQVSAINATSFVDSLGDHSAFLLAAGGALAGYALTSDDPEYVCSAQGSLASAATQAEIVNATVQENLDELSGLAKEATYLPAGFDQVDIGYDTCPLTGVGHYLDDNNQIHFANCDPEERVIKIDCRSGSAKSAQLVDNAPGVVTTWLNPKTNPCVGGQGQKFFEDPYTYVRAPSCVKRLSGFKQEGKYLSCDTQSTTYASCGKQLNGSGDMPFPPPIKGATPSTVKTGAFNLCVAPSGTQTINHLAEFNAILAERIETGAAGAEAGLAVASEEVDSHLAEAGQVCGEEGGNSGIAGAALGAAAGGAVGLLSGDIDVAGSMEDVTNKFSGVSDKISGVLGEGEFTDKFSDFSSGLSDQMNGLTSGISEKFGGMTEGMTSAASGVTEGMKDSLGGMTEGLSDSFGGMKDSFGGMTEGLTDSFSGISDSVSEMTSGVTDSLSGITEGMGLGSLSSFTSKLGALSSFNGSAQSLVTVATQLEIMPKMLGTMISMFNNDKLIPLYISEMHEDTWRDESPGSKMARMASFQSVPLASSVVGFSKNLSQANCGEVGVWGQLCPLRGFVETSGDNLPASGLAGWKAYHHALAKVPDRKRMQERPTVFNLDYPHTSACYEIGEDPEAWESRRSDRGGGIFGGGLLGNMFGGLSSGLDSMVSSVADGTSLGGLFGSSEDSRLESGVFVYTYWKETECTWDVCTLNQEIIDFESEK